MSYRPVTDGLSYRRPLTGRLRHLSQQQQQGESVFPFLLKPLSQSNEFGWEKDDNFRIETRLAISTNAPPTIRLNTHRVAIIASAAAETM